MKTRWTLWAVPVVFVLAGTALAQDQPAPEPGIVAEIAVEEANVPAPLEVADEELCGDLTSENETVANISTAAAPGGCKTCKGRTWCKCTYNGNPRVSCDPCCYRTYAGTLVCFD